MNKKHLTVVRLLLVLPVVCSLVAITATPASAAAAVYLGASSGYPGQGITGNGSGWAPGATITMTLAGNPVTTSPATIYVGTGVAPYGWTSGTWTGSFVVPTIPGGAYTGINGLRITDGASVVYLDFTVTQLAAVSPTSGPVGTVVTVIGKGFKDGSSASVTLGGNPVVTSPYPIPVAADGTLSGTMLIPETTSGGLNAVVVTDGAGNSGTVATGFTVRPSLSLNPTTGLSGCICVATGTHFTPGATVEIKFQGTSLVPAVTVTDTDNDGKVTTAFTVPLMVGGLPTTPGEKTVRAVNTANPSEFAEATFTVAARVVLTLSPSSSPIGTRTTVSSANMTPGATITAANVLFAGAAWPGAPATISVDSLGNMSPTTLTVPMAETGPQQVQVTDPGADYVYGTADDVVATGTFTVTQLTISLDKTHGYRGEMITLTGYGFKDGSSATVTLGGYPVVTDPYPIPVEPDGTLSGTMTIPETASPGENAVVVTDGENLATVAFTVLEADVNVYPKKGRPGERVTISGSNFLPRAAITVDFGGQPLELTPTTGTTGDFALSAAVPSLAPGTKTVSASDGVSTASDIFTLLPPLGWCCQDGEVYETSEETCTEQGGSFFLSQDDAEERCSRPLLEWWAIVTIAGGAVLVLGGATILFGGGTQVVSKFQSLARKVTKPPTLDSIDGIRETATDTRKALEECKELLDKLKDQLEQLELDNKAKQLEERLDTIIQLAKHAEHRLKAFAERALRPDQSEELTSIREMMEQLQEHAAEAKKIVREMSPRARAIMEVAKAAVEKHVPMGKQLSQLIDMIMG